LESAYRITAGYPVGFADWFYDNRWYDKDEYLIARLKDLI